MKDEHIYILVFIIVSFVIIYLSVSYYLFEKKLKSERQRKDKEANYQIEEICNEIYDIKYLERRNEIENLRFEHDRMMREIEQEENRKFNIQQKCQESSKRISYAGKSILSANNLITHAAACCSTFNRFRK